MWKLQDRIDKLVNAFIQQRSGGIRKFCQGTEEESRPRQRRRRRTRRRQLAQIFFFNFYHLGLAHFQNFLDQNNERYPTITIN
jgi:hypothetical protein